MRSLRFFLVLAIAAGVAAGCKKKPKDTQPDAEPPKHVSSGGGALAPNQSGNLSVSGGGGGGAVQATRKAAARTVNDAQMKDLHLSLSQTWLLDNRLPTAKEIMDEARKNPQLLPLLQEEVIILTGATRGDQVWAYTQYPQRAGEHYVITSQGVEQMPPEALRGRLEQQGAPVKLAK